MIRVYHLSTDKLTDNSLFGKMAHFLWIGFGRESLAVKSANRLFTDSDDYQLVASVDGDDLDDAYRLTNTIHQAWWMNDGLKAVAANTRSTSVGDLLLRDDGSLHLVRPVGFVEVPA